MGDVTITDIMDVDLRLRFQMGQCLLHRWLLDFCSTSYICKNTVSSIAEYENLNLKSFEIASDSRKNAREHKK